MKSLIVIMSVLLLCVITKGKKLPNIIQKCKRDDPDLGQCINDRIEKLRPFFVEGIPALYIPPLEPFIVPRIDVSTNLGISWTWYNISISDIPTFGIRDLKFNLQKNTINVDIIVPKIHVKLIYHLTGKLSLITLDSKGTAELNLTDVHSISTEIGTREIRKGKEYVTFNEKPKPKITYGRPSMYHYNLIPGNEELTKQLNQVFNDNIDEIVAEVKPTIDSTIYEIIFSLVKTVFSRFSIDELFD